MCGSSCSEYLCLRLLTSELCSLSLSLSTAECSWWGCFLKCGLIYNASWCRFDFDNMKDGLYIAPAFMDKLVIHVAKNFLNLPNIKVPLILGVWGGKGQGKSFQSELVMAKLGIK